MANKKTNYQKNTKHAPKSDYEKSLSEVRKRFDALAKGLEEVDYSKHFYPENSEFPIQGQFYIDIINTVNTCKVTFVKQAEAISNLLKAVNSNIDYLDGIILPIMEKHLENIKTGITNKLEEVPQVEEPVAEQTIEENAE